MSYAVNTSVPIERSQNEIKKILQKYGATGFVYGENGPTAVVGFEMAGRRIKFILPMPVHMKERNKKNILLSRVQVDQLARSRWRCLVLAIKAKLECVESGITTLEQEFMAHIVLPNGSTVGQVMTPQIESSYKSGNMPPLLGYSG